MSALDKLAESFVGGMQDVVERQIEASIYGQSGAAGLRQQELQRGTELQKLAQKQAAEQQQRQTIIRALPPEIQASAAGMPLAQLGQLATSLIEAKQKPPTISDAQRKAAFAFPDDPEAQRTAVAGTFERTPLVNIEDKAQTALQVGRETRRLSREDKIIQGGEIALGIKNSLPTMRQSLELAGETGELKPYEVAISNIGNFLGFDVDTKRLAAAETFAAEAKRLILPSIKTLGSNPSNADRKFIEAAFVDLTKSKEGITKLLDLQEGLADRAIALNDWLNENQGLTTKDFGKELTKWQKSNPLKNYVRPSAPQGGLTPAQQRRLQELEARE